MDSDLNHKVSSCAQNVVINDTKSIRSLGTSKIMQGLVVGPLLFKLFKFAGDTKLGRVADTLSFIRILTRGKNGSTEVSWSSTKSNSSAPRKK